MRYEKDRLFEHHDRPVRKTSYIEDRTQEPLVEKMRPRQPELSQREQAMLRSASLLDD
jgi:hypothetical protein